MKKNIQSVSDSYLCSNCGACIAICPKNAIELHTSGIGRLYAQVNESCIDCGLCKKICPSLDELNLHTQISNRFIGNIENVYVGRTNNEVIFQNAQSGGVATGILSFLFDKSLIDAAILCKIEYGDISKGTPVIVTSQEELAQTQKSCYTPVPLLSVLGDVKKYQSVAVVGLPCHIQGLEAILHITTKYNVKYKIGLICDRTECCGIQYVIKDFTGFDNFKIDWRKKYNEKTGKYNYASAPIVAISTDGSCKELPRSYRIGLKDFFTPPRCRVCWDKLNVFSDISLGDPWRLEGINMVEGESLIISRSHIGQELIEKLVKSGDLLIKPIDTASPVKSQLIADRRQSVEKYSRAFSEIPQYIDSYLLHQHNIEIGECSVDEEIAKLSKFLERDNMNRDEIVAQSKEEIEKFEKCKRKNNKLINRIIKRIDNFFKL